MTRYLIFTNKNDSSYRPADGSAEYVACEIASSAIWDHFPAQFFIAYPEHSSEATFESLKGTPKFSLELDQAKIDLWFEELKPICDKLDEVRDSIDQSFNSIFNAVSNLDLRCQESQYFSVENLADAISFHSAFEEIENDSSCQFSEKVHELYAIQYYQNAD
jgi:hypothetical protein